MYTLLANLRTSSLTSTRFLRTNSQIGFIYSTYLPAVLKIMFVEIVFPIVAQNVSGLRMCTEPICMQKQLPIHPSIGQNWLYDLWVRSTAKTGWVPLSRFASKIETVKLLRMLSEFEEDDAYIWNMHQERTLSPFSTEQKLSFAETIYMRCVLFAPQNYGQYFGIIKRISDSRHYWAMDRGIFIYVEGHTHLSDECAKN